MSKSGREQVGMPVEEEMYAFYLRCGSYKKTADHFGRPLSTVWTLIQRLAGDSLEADRTAMRADLMRKAWDKVAELIDEVQPACLGTEKNSRGSEAARALADIGRTASLLEPKEKPEQVAPPTINVYTGCAPPAEIAVAGPTTTTTLDALPPSVSTAENSPHE